jgi:hypothetical protein
MPDVGYDNKPVKHELQTAPPDGYVMLRRLPYDEILKRREMATRLSMEQSSGGRRNGQLVDFSKPKLAFRLVAPEVLQEIEMALSELNLETDEDELNDFMSAARPSSSEEPTLQSVPTESD